MPSPRITANERVSKPLLDVSIISHGTLASYDLQASRRFYEQVLGFEVAQLSPMSMIARKGTDHVYVVVQGDDDGVGMPFLAHNGIDLPSRAAVDEAHRVLHEVKEDYGIRRINPVHEQHGVYAFYFVDLDRNWWEVQCERRPRRGYAWVFDEPSRDLTDRYDVDPELMEHVLDDEVAARLRVTLPKG